GATVSCVVAVNGVPQEATRLTVHGTGAIVGAQQISFAAAEVDQFNECQTVTFDDGSIWTSADGNVGTDCPIETVSGPPIIDQVVALVESVLNTARAIADSVAKQFVDPIVCPIFITLGNLVGGGVLGVLRIYADGDVY